MPARESPPRVAYYEPAAEIWPTAPAYVRPNAIVCHSSAQLAGASRRTAAGCAMLPPMHAALLTRAARPAAVDDARYSLQSMSPINPLDVRRSAVVALVALAVDPDTRRLVRHHKLSPVFLVRVCDTPHAGSIF